MNPQQQRLKQLAEETNALRKEALKAEDINKLFDFADKAKEFEDAWISARGRKKAKPDRITNPYTGKEINKKGMRPSREVQSYKDVFIEMSKNFPQNDFVQRLIRDFTPSTQETIKNLISESDEKMPELVDRYIQIQKQGVAGIEQMLTAVPAQEVPVAEEIPAETPPAREGPGRIIPTEETPPVAQILAQNIQGAVQAGIDVARIPFDQLGNNLARRIMRPDLLPAPAMERRRGRGAGNWRNWIVDTVRTVGTTVGTLSTIAGIGSYLYHTIMGNTPKKNKAETEQILRDAGIVPDGTIEDALKTKENLEELFETYKRERRQAEAEAEAEPVTPEAEPTAPDTQTTAQAPEVTEEVVMDSEEFQRRVREAQEVERRQREATRDPQPPPLARPNVEYPDLRKGHFQKIAMEQMLRLKKEEEDRRIATLYTNNPDDYMSAGVPNPYERPMYSDEWVDIKRLQRLQTPEYTRREQEIWARNYQTPYQLGEGTSDNSVKDIQNVVERIAQLERRLRYDYATKGLPRDERHPAVNWGAPTQRMGVMPKTRHERWDAYLNVVDKYDMDKYQYLQRQNQPPHSKLINRDAVFGLTRPTPDIPSQQHIYDERMNESSTSSGDYLDIQNDMDYEYFRRRIRKD